VLGEIVLEASIMENEAKIIVRTIIMALFSMIEILKENEKYTQ